MKYFLLCTLLFASKAFATITISPGEYSIPAIVFIGPVGPVATFNLKSRSKLSLALTGEKAKALGVKGSLHAYKLKIRVDKKISSSRGEAALLDFTATQEKIPGRVGNDFSLMK